MSGDLVRIVRKMECLFVGEMDEPDEYSSRSDGHAAIKRDVISVSGDGTKHTKNGQTMRLRRAECVHFSPSRSLNSTFTDVKERKRI